jgi:hypothetical protein
VSFVHGRCFAFRRSADFREIPSRLAILRRVSGFRPVFFAMASRFIVLPARLADVRWRMSARDVSVCWPSGLALRLQSDLDQTAELRTSTIPSRILPCDCQERLTVSHFDQTQFNQLRYASLVDYPRAFCSNILQRPSEIDRIKSVGEVLVGYQASWAARA